MMDFGSPEETLRAMALAFRYLPRLVGAFEDGLVAMGFAIEERSHYVDGDGAVVPVLVGRRGAATLRLELRNAFEDFLAVDREERPVRLDPRLDDAGYADGKLAGVVRDRLDVARAAAEGSQERIEALGDRFAWLRVTRFDGPDAPA